MTKEQEKLMRELKKKVEILSNIIETSLWVEHIWFGDKSVYKYGGYWINKYTGEVRKEPPWYNAGIIEAQLKEINTP